MSEDILELYSSFYRVHYHMLYFYNVYGARESDYGEYSTVVRAFKKCVENDVPLRVFGSGKKERDFTHIYDVIDGILKLLSEKKKPQHIHLGRGKPTSVLDVAKAFGHPMVHEFDKAFLKPILLVVRIRFMIVNMMLFDISKNGKKIFLDQLWNNN